MAAAALAVRVLCWNPGARSRAGGAVAFLGSAANESRAGSVAHGPAALGSPARMTRGALTRAASSIIWVCSGAYCAALSQPHEPAEPGRAEDLLAGAS
jgi:hypothetical protein